MSISQKMTQCYKLLNDDSYNSCLTKALHQLGSKIKLTELKSIINNKSILEDVTIEKVDEHNITIKEFFDEFVKTVQYTFRQTLNDLVFGIIKELLILKNTQEKESMVSDVIILLRQLESDSKYFNEMLKNARVPYYNNINCKTPFSRYYNIRLNSVLNLYLKKISERYYFHISEYARTYIDTSPSLQAFFQLYSISEWEKTINDQSTDEVEYPILTWIGKKNDLTELTIGLIHTGSLKIEYGKNTQGNIGATIFNLFNLDVNMTQVKFWGAINDLKKRGNSKAAFLNTLSKAYEEYVTKKDSLT